MRTFFLMSLTTLLLSSLAFSQEKDIPQIVRMALPSYPTPAIILGVEEVIEVTLQIEKSGKVISIESNAKRPFFHTVIKEAFNEWEFEESDQERRDLIIRIAFRLLPYESKSSITSSFKLPDTIEIFAKKVKIIDRPSY
ncbi:MAG: hypothetical protein IPM50_01225 [Acidobacteriota bacterium]|nr:MAG: hypothetical protein IPM50_01225 [Acidobacteriota bacterium]